MRFLAGPRQSGKTTLSQAILKSKSSLQYYYHWDNRAVRKRYQNDPDFLSGELALARQKEPWVVFDEIHKYPKWKNVLKGIYDECQPAIRLIVTGSARLDLLRRAGDSLAGRYFVFHLFPLSLHEAIQRLPKTLTFPDKDPAAYIENRLSTAKYYQPECEQLLRTSGFPEPFLKPQEAFQRHWHRDYFDRLIREELRDLTRIEKIEHALQLADFVAEGVGSPLSVNSLRENLEDSYNAVRNYLRGFRLTYVTFEVRPYSHKIRRGIQKASKIYLFDWTLVKEPAKRFENYVAFELLRWAHFWTDAGHENFELRYIRRRDGRETDFLLLRDKAPWILFEAKLQDQRIERHHYDHAALLGAIPIVQIVYEKGVARKGKQNDYRISASRFFA